MSTPETPTSAPLPGYIANAVPNPPTNRAAWFKNTAPTYAGIFLWFVYWQDAVKTATPGGALAAGVGVALLGILIAALICHFLFYLVPGLFGVKTGLPLYIVGTSTFGATGGFLMPGFLMGLLQFGWLGVNTYFSSLMVAQVVPVPPEVIMVVWGIGAALLGLMGIQYVAKVSTYLPLIPLVILIVLLVKTIGGVGSFDPQMLINESGTIAASPVVEEIDAVVVEDSEGNPVAAIVAETDEETVAGEGEEVAAAVAEAGEEERPAAVSTSDDDVTPEEKLAAPAPMSTLAILAFLITYVVGFFATAGAAGVDFGMNNRDTRDVQLGGLVGVALVGLFAAGATVLIVAGVHGTPEWHAAAVAAASPEDPSSVLNSVNLIPIVMGENVGKWLSLLLALAAFPPACFSSFIAANCFKTTLPKVNPFISVGIGAAISIALALTGLAGQVVPVFQVIGASFGPICGAFAVDYILSGYTWSGPRAGFNPAGWIAWALGFLVGILPLLGVAVPAAPLAAFIVGAVVYFLCAKAGLLSTVIPMPTQTVPPVEPEPVQS